MCAAGITSRAVAAALGHESFRTMESSAQRDAVTSAQQKKVLSADRRRAWHLTAARARKEAASPVAGRRRARHHWRRRAL